LIEHGLTSPATQYRFTRATGKIQDRRQINNTDITKTKRNPEKANNAKYSKTKLVLLSRFRRHSARKQGGLILQRYRAHNQSLFHVRGQTTESAVLPFTGQSCGTVFQPISVCWTFHCQCSGNDWKCSCSRI